MAKNTQQNNSQPEERKETVTETRTIAGVRFEIDAEGFVSSSAGDLGHLEDCQAVAEVFKAFLDVEAPLEADASNEVPRSA